jgi:RNA-directed DNA polymerase
VNKAKPFNISKQLVWEAFKRVKANRGAAGADGQSIQQFEEDLENNLYKLWNRLSSGSYFPSPVRRVEIPKKDGGLRPLGIPTVSDRIAQMVVRMCLEPKLEPIFHEDSYAYRPRKSAIQAVGVARERCWRFDWLIDLDIRGFFDNIDHDLVMRAMRWHTDCKWTLLYVERWLKAPVALRDGTIISREKGNPQGGVISPLLANLFLHYAFDRWMRGQWPYVPFERYADDVIAHCKTETQAQQILESIRERLEQCKLELHPEKTKIVYCKDDTRRGSYPTENFDFLGFTFRARRSKNRWGKHFVNFSPAMSNKAATRARQEMRAWRLHTRSDKSIEDLSRMVNPILRGWITYYGSYYKSGVYPVFRHFNRILMRWATRKYKRLKSHRQRAEHWLGRIARKEPKLFAPWDLTALRPTAG